MPPSPAQFPYRRIAEDLRAAIVRGQLAPGERLPSENQLVERYNTTRSTVRKAIAVLRADGLVVSEQGRGAFVRPQPRIRLLATGSNYRERRGSGVAHFNAEVAAQGYRAEQRIVSVGVVPAPAEIAGRLGLAEGDAVVARRRLFLVEDEPAQLADSYYPAELAEGTTLAAPGKVRGGALALIEAHLGTRVVRFLEEFEARMPSPEESATLRLLPGVPVVRMIRTAFTERDDAVEVLDSLLAADKYTFRYETRVD